MQNFRAISLRSIYFFLFSFLIFSCSNDADNPNLSDGELSKTEVQTVLQMEELSSVADDLITEIFQAGATARTNKNNECYQADYSDTGFSVTFENCSVDGSENLNGTLTAVYETGMNSTAVVVSFSNLMAGDITINGTRSFVFNTSNDENTIAFTITSDMTIVRADGSEVTESGTKTVSLIFDGNLENGLVTLDGQWTVGVDGNTYAVVVDSLLETPFNCEYVAKGLMLLAKNGLEVTVDFGDGSCDELATLIYPDGTEETYNLND